jgi:hypothetical protein
MRRCGRSSKPEAENYRLHVKENRMAKKKSRKVRIPSLREYNGRACADFKRERVYFGKAGTPEAEEAYRRTLALRTDACLLEG